MRYWQKGHFTRRQNCLQVHSRHKKKKKLLFQLACKKSQAGFYLLCFVCNAILIRCGFRGPGRRKKNPDIPPELLNNPFKHFKVDHHADRPVNLSNGEPMKTDDVNKSISRDPSPNAGVSVTFEGARDANNNATGAERKDLQFRTPISRPPERVVNMTSSQTAMNHTSPHLHASPRYSTTHVIHSPTNTPSSRIMSPPSGVILAPNSQSCAFNFPSRPQVSLSPQGNVLSPPTNGVPPVSCASTVVNHSPRRSPNSGDALNVEASVPHVSSTGTSEHVDLRNAIANDTGSEMSASSPHVLLREVCIGIFFVVVMKCVFHSFP